MKSIAAICLAATASACDWIWEECSWMWYRSTCDGEDGETDCGWVYWDDWNYEEFWVTCDEFADWWWCTGEEAVCLWGDEDDYWWDECWGAYWAWDCEDWESGWWFWDADWEEWYWVTADDYGWWCW